MKTFFRKAFVICLFLAITLTIIEIAVADPIEEYETTATIQETEENILIDSYITVLDPINWSPVAKISDCLLTMFDGKSTTIWFEDSSESATAWKWNFGDGKTSNEQNPEHTYSYTGNYVVTLTVYNEWGKDSTTRIISAIGQSVPQAAA